MAIPGFCSIFRHSNRLTELPTTGLDAAVVLAAPTFVDVVEVHVERDIVRKRILVIITTNWWAPRRTPIPFRGLGYLGLGRAEELRRSPIPLRLCVRPQLHVWIHVAAHLAPRDGIVLRGAFVVLVRLLALATGVA